jgi:Cu(I)/Ag(I) efflux system membrane fusion protein
MAAGNKGADWLQKQKEIRNPYFGKSMLTCGTLVKSPKG